jgi:hypothetical protein
LQPQGEEVSPARNRPDTPVLHYCCCYHVEKPMPND